MSEPREFWIDHDVWYSKEEKDYVEANQTEYPVNFSNLVHVVEYSAFEQLQAENSKLKEKLSVAVEILEYYANTDNWELTAIDSLCTVKTKLTKDKESFGEVKIPGKASKLVVYGGKMARQVLAEIIAN